MVKPAFVKRVLSSHACRYAAMFGDVLGEEICIKLIFSLSQCNLSFICAHGRPSIAPLIDLSLVSTIDCDCILGGRLPNDTNVQSTDTHVPLRFQSRYPRSTSLESG